MIKKKNPTDFDFILRHVQTQAQWLLLEASWQDDRGLQGDQGERFIISET